MNIRTKYESPLKLERLCIAECHFARSEEPLGNLTLDVRIKRRIELSGTDKYKMILELFIGDDAKKLDINIKCVAHFETAHDNLPLVEKNMLAIMFPYVRSYVSTVTAQPGMAPIVLPAINIAAMFQDD